MCLEVRTGKQLWKLNMPKGRAKFKSSPILAGGNLYVTREDGTTFVVSVGLEPRVIATNAVEEMVVATPVLVDGRLYLRSDETLYCIGS
ncbi:MAG: hypothetical protein CMJ48_12185 [Planctomycetaceae bacterium]|nr:hypothetical protein [Planctomycetaceae bacterium]